MSFVIFTRWISCVRAYIGDPVDSLWCGEPLVVLVDEWDDMKDEAELPRGALR